MISPISMSHNVSKTDILVRPRPRPTFVFFGQVFFQVFFVQVTLVPGRPVLWSPVADSLSVHGFNEDSDSTDEVSSSSLYSAALKLAVRPDRRIYQMIRMT